MLRLLHVLFNEEAIKMSMHLLYIFKGTYIDLSHSN